MAGENVDLGTISASFEIKLDGIRTARTDLKRELRGMAGDMEDLEEKGGASAKRLTNSWTRLARSDAFRSIGHSATVSGTAIVGAFAVATKAAADYDQAMRNVNSIAKLSEQQFADLKKEVRGVASDPQIRQGPRDLATALYDVYSSGFKGKEALDVLRTSAYGASAGMTNTAVSGKALMAVLNSQIKGVNDAKHGMDILFKTVDLGVGSFEELAGSIGNVIGTAAKSGVTLQEVGAFLAVATRQGQTFSDASNDLLNVLTKIIRPSDEAKKMMDKLGISYGLSALQAKGLTGILDEVIKGTKGNQDALGRLFPDMQAFRGVLSGTQADGQSYNGMLREMQGAQEGAGSTQKALTEQNKGAVAQFQLLKKEVEELAIEIGEELLPMLRDGVKGVRDVTKAIADVPDDTKKAIVGIGLIGGAFALVTGNVISLITRIAELKVALATLKIPTPVLAAMGLTAAGISAVGAGAVGTYYGVKGILRENGIVGQNQINDNALPPHVETAGALADAREGRQKLFQQRRSLETKLKARKTWLDNSPWVSPGAKQRELGVMQAPINAINQQIEASAVEIQRLDKIYKTQRASFDKAARADGRPKAPVTPKKGGAGGGGGGGGGNTEVSEEAKRLAEQLKESGERAKEIEASASIKHLKEAYDVLFQNYRKNGGAQNLSRLQSLSGVIADRERQAARIKRDNAAPGDRPAAEAEFSAATGKNGEIARDANSRLRERKEAYEDRQRKLAEERAASEEQSRQRQQAREQAQADEEASLDAVAASVAEAWRERTRIIQDEEDEKQRYLYDTDQQSRADYRAYLAGRLRDYAEYSKEWYAISRALFDLDEQTRRDKEQAEKEADRARKERERDAERERKERDAEAKRRAQEQYNEDVQRYRAVTGELKGFFRGVFSDIERDGFENLAQNILKRFKQLIAELLVEWAASKLTELVANAAGIKKPEKPGTGSGPGGSSMDMAANAALGIPGAAPYVAAYYGLKSIFKFDKGGMMPAGRAAFVAEAGTGGELVVPRTPSMALPVNLLKQIGMSSNGGDTFHIAPIIHATVANETDAMTIARDVAWLVHQDMPVRSGRTN